MDERGRLIVPLCEVANHARAVLNTVVPLRGPPDRCVHVISKHDVNRDAITPRVIDRHRCVLQAYGAVSQHCHRSAFDFEVPMGHRHRRFFMTIRDELGIPIAAVVDDRFLHSPKTGSRVGADVLETQRFDHINHVVRAATVGRQDLDFACSSGRLLFC